MTKTKNSNQNNNGFPKGLTYYFNIGTQLAVTILIAFFLGKLLDDNLDTFPFITVTLSFLGTFTGIYRFIRTIIELDKKKSNNNQFE
ncbi:MAG: AtpZ/AtpI family protein [Ignavibacteriales bacterium]|nr:AtpZ/AtpI family protein [Ignavibacteriales bacterium]